MSVPKIWVPTDKLLADELNANFQFICDQLALQPDTIAQFNQRVSDLEACKVEHEQQIESLQSDMEQAQEDIQDLETRVAILENP